MPTSAGASAFGRRTVDAVEQRAPALGARQCGLSMGRSMDDVHFRERPAVLVMA